MEHHVATHASTRVAVESNPKPFNFERVAPSTVQLLSDTVMDSDVLAKVSCQLCRGIFSSQTSHTVYKEISSLHVLVMCDKCIGEVIAKKIGQWT